MSHTDYILEAPEGFDVVATTKNCPVAAMHNVDNEAIRCAVPSRS